MGEIVINQLDRHKKISSIFSFYEINIYMILKMIIYRGNILCFHFFTEKASNIH